MPRKPRIELAGKYHIKDITDIKQRNKVILQAIEQGYSQHMIAKVLGISQQVVYGVVKRSRR